MGTIDSPALTSTAAACLTEPLARTGTNREAQRRRRRYRRALLLMKRTGIPFLVGGGYAVRHYAGGMRGTKDLDVFVRRRDAIRLLRGLSADGFETDLTFPHWLGKARDDGTRIDIIFSSGNRLAEVDDAWFTHSVDATVLRVPVRMPIALFQAGRPGCRAPNFTRPQKELPDRRTLDQVSGRPPARTGPESWCISRYRLGTQSGMADA